MRFLRKNQRIDAISIARLTITATRNLIYIFLLIIGFGIAVATFFGLKTYRDIRTLKNSINNDVKIVNDYRSEIEKQVFEVNSQIRMGREKIDSIDFVFKKVKSTDIQMNALSKKYTGYEEELDMNKGLTESLKKKIDDINNQLELLSNIFNRVAVAHQGILTGREKLLLYLLAAEIDDTRPDEDQNPEILINLGRMWLSTQEPKIAKQRFNQAEKKRKNLNEKWRNILDESNSYCDNILNKSKEDSLLIVLNPKILEPKIFDRLTRLMFLTLVYRGYFSYNDLMRLQKDLNIDLSQFN